MLFPTIPTNCPTNCRHWPVLPRGRMADRFISTASPADNCRPSRPFARSASIRIHFPPNSTASATAASRSSPSPGPTSCTDSSSFRATTARSTPATPSPPTFPATTATSSTEPSTALSRNGRPSSSAPSSATPPTPTSTPRNLRLRRQCLKPAASSARAPAPMFRHASICSWARRTP